MRKTFSNRIKEEPEVRMTNQMTFSHVLIVIPMTILLFLGFFALFQYIGEQLGIFPYIILNFGENVIFTSTEGIVLFIISLVTSILVAMLVVILFLRFTRSRKK